MVGKSWLCEVLGVDEKELEKHKQKQKPADEVVEKLLPKKQDKANNGGGGASSGASTNANKNAVTINKPPSPTTMIGSSAADDPLAAYGEELAKQKQEKALQMLWGMAGADDIWGQKAQPKAPTAAETLRPWGLGNTTGQMADQDGVADYQKPGSGTLVDTANKADSDPLALLKKKWQQEQHRTGGGIVNDDGELPDWMNNDGHITTLPTFGDTLKYYNGTDKEGSTSTENNSVKSYLGKSFNQFWRGNYTDDVTALGTAAQLATGFFDLDLPADIRDLSYDITHWQTTPEHIGQTILDAVGLIPVIGMVKYADELGTLAKNADEAADVAKEADEAAKGAAKAGTVITEIKYKSSSGVTFKAKPDKTTTILGSYEKDMKNVVNEMGNVKSTDFGAREGGFNVLNVPDDMYKDADQFWNEINKPWLDEVIKRGDDIVLATKPQGKVMQSYNKLTGKWEPSGFAREYQYLCDKGYHYDSTTNMLVK